MLSVIDIARRIDQGALSPHDAIRQSFDAIASRDGDVNAFVHVDRGVAVRESGPLRGIAVGIKDIIDTADMPTEMGAAIYAGWRPKADASVVAMLRRVYRMPGGLSWDELTDTLKTHLASDRSRGLSITIFNPDLDPEGTIARSFVDALVRALV